MTVTRRLERSRPTSDLSVSQLSLQELHQELRRRVTNLQKQREELVEKIESIDRELEAIGAIKGSAIRGGAADGRIDGRQRRAKNKAPLAQVLVEVLKQGPPTRKEAAEAAIAAGYLSESKNFSNSVGVVLHRGKQFVKKGGKWRLADDL